MKRKNNMIMIKIIIDIDIIQGLIIKRILKLITMRIITTASSKTALVHHRKNLVPSIIASTKKARTKHPTRRITNPAAISAPATTTSATSATATPVASAVDTIRTSTTPQRRAMVMIMELGTITLDILVMGILEDIVEGIMILMSVNGRELVIIDVI